MAQTSTRAKWSRSSECTGTLKKYLTAPTLSETPDYNNQRWAAIMGLRAILIIEVKWSGRPRRLGPILRAPPSSPDL